MPTLHPFHALRQEIQPMQRRDPVPAVVEVPRANPVPYEPHCLMSWAEMVKGMDDAGQYAEARQ